MTTMNISLPDSMKVFVDAQIKERGYGSSSEYIRDLIRNDEIRQAEKRLAALMLEGMESGPPIPAGKTYWEKKREQLMKR